MLLDAEVIVIGAGFWGSAIGLELGPRALLLDAGLAGAASRVAGGLVRESSLEGHFPSWWREAHGRACRRFLEQWGERGEEWVVNQRGAGGRMRQGLWQLWPPELLQPAVRYRVERLEPRSGGWLVHGAEGFLSASQVVVAAGFFCDGLLQRSGLKTLGLRPLPGAALLGPGRVALEQPCVRGYRLPGDSRTRTVTARNWGAGWLRVGDTCGASEGGQMAMLHRWYAGVGGQGPARRVGGIRPKLARGMMVEQWAPRLVVASGGGRTGLSHAAGVALRVRELLGERG